MEFPPPRRDNPLDRWKWQQGAKPPVQRAPSIAAPGLPFRATPRPNLQRLGVTYGDAGQTAIVNPAAAIGSPSKVGGVVAPRVPRALGSLRAQLTGTSRTSAGVVLGNCRVMVFRTEDKSFVGETVSDGAGAWTLDLMVSGPFFFVEYLAGVPDVAGTSKNNLVTVPG